MSIQLAEGYSPPSVLFATTPTTSYGALFPASEFSDATKRYPFTTGMYIKCSRSAFTGGSAAKTIAMLCGFNNNSDTSYASSFAAYEQDVAPTAAASDKGNGTNRSAGIVQSSVGVNYNDQWFFVACRYLSATFRKVLIIDPSDGAILASSSSSLWSNPFNRNDDIGLSLRLTGNTFDPQIRIAELITWREAIVDSELQTFAQVGFAHTNRPANLLQDINFIYNWTSEGDPLQVDDYGPHGMHATLPSASEITYTTDAPVPVFLTEISDSQPLSTSFSLFSVQAGTAYAALYPSGTAQPSDSDIVNGVGALSTGSVSLSGTTSSVVTLATPATGVDYIAYFAQDIADAGTSYNLTNQSFTSPVQYFETVVDVNGSDLASISNIEYTWFDSTDFSNLGSPKVTGSTENTDGSGLLRISLPVTAIATAKGSSGTMILKVDDAGTVRTGAHIVTVK